MEGFLQMAVVQSRKILGYARINLSTAGEPVDETFLGRIVDHPENNNFSFAVDTLPKPFPAPALIVAGRQYSTARYRDAGKIQENSRGEHLWSWIIWGISWGLNRKTCSNPRQKSGLIGWRSTQARGGDLRTLPHICRWTPTQN